MHDCEDNLAHLSPNMTITAMNGIFSSFIQLSRVELPYLSARALPTSTSVQGRQRQQRMDAHGKGKNNKKINFSMQVSSSDGKKANWHQSAVRYRLRLERRAEQRLARERPQRRRVVSANAISQYREPITVLLPKTYSRKQKFGSRSARRANARSQRTTELHGT